MHGISLPVVVDKVVVVVLKFPNFKPFKKKGKLKGNQSYSLTFPVHASALRKKLVELVVKPLGQKVFPIHVYAQVG